MAIPMRNTVYEKIKHAGHMTDVELSKALLKDGHQVAADRFNKILLDLEIMGIIRVTWLTKDTRRIETVENPAEEDPVERQNREAMEKDYEASFPGAEN